jgi:hypothetical protein
MERKRSSGGLFWTPFHHFCAVACWFGCALRFFICDLESWTSSRSTNLYISKRKIFCQGRRSASMQPPATWRELLGESNCRDRWRRHSGERQISVDDGGGTLRVELDFRGLSSSAIEALRRGEGAASGGSVMRWASGVREGHLLEGGGEEWDARRRRWLARHWEEGNWNAMWITIRNCVLNLTCNRFCVSLNHMHFLAKQSCQICHPLISMCLEHTFEKIYALDILCSLTHSPFEKYFVHVHSTRPLYSCI